MKKKKRKVKDVKCSICRRNYLKWKMRKATSERGEIGKRARFKT